MSNRTAPDPSPAPGGRAVSFLSDFGTADEFVGVVHSVLVQLAPGVTVVDVCHEIAPFDVRGGSLTLARAMQYLAPGVVLAVVDPGVGTQRRAVAVQLEAPAGGSGSFLVGPDNGLMAPAVAMAGGASRAVELDNPTYHLQAPGPTFAGRDVFAPAAAHLCRGVELSDLGTEIDPLSLLPGLLPLPREEGGRLLGEVLWVDRFGNVQVNVDPEDLERLGPELSLRAGDSLRSLRRVDAFAELGPGALGVMVDSYGMLAVVAHRDSAAATLGLAAGDQLEFSAPSQ